MLFRDADGKFDLNSALALLEEKYGLKVATNHEPAKKRKADDTDPLPSKVPKTSLVAVEENRPLADSIKEMADIFFKNKDARKGGKS